MTTTAIPVEVQGRILDHLKDSGHLDPILTTFLSVFHDTEDHELHQEICTAHIEPDEARDVMASDQGITDLYQDSPARLEQCGDKVCWAIAVQASGISTRTPTQTFASLSPG
ncbi:hypothetical protein C8J57DRAFT_1246451 [Mycena rebaudengoi]|nr:hypothetical protein C8J57DRAFT_1246451 [Mycena rebaudengoi]